MTGVFRERRRFQRQPREGKVTLHWTDPEGIQRQETAHVRDIGRVGLSCVVGTRIAAFTAVKLEAKAESINCYATVRHCRPKGLNFIIGLEFHGGVEWYAPDEEPAHSRWD